MAIEFKHFGNVTVAKLGNTEYDALNAICRLTHRNSKFLELRAWSVKMSDIFTGRSKLDPRDEYNEATGDAIAKKKALQKYHAQYDKKIVEFLKDVQNLETATKKYCADHGIEY